MRGKPYYELATAAEKLAGDCRAKSDWENNVMSKAEVQTLRYCGVMAAMIAHMLCELEENLRPQFTINMANGILREWGMEELTDVECE